MPLLGDLGALVTRGDRRSLYPRTAPNPSCNCTYEETDNPIEKGLTGGGVGREGLASFGGKRTTGRRERPGSRESGGGIESLKRGSRDRPRQRPEKNRSRRIETP